MTTVTVSELVLPGVLPGAENPLPPLRNLEQVHRVLNLDELPADMAAGIRYGQLDSVAPCLVQDGYHRDRAEVSLPAIVLDNGIVKATFLPSLGGRLYSLTHRGRELLYRNPVLQPANLALRDAWFAGGVEWNMGSTGHTTLTCEPLHAGVVAGPDGVPMLRMWEWERTRGLPVQIDAWLPEGSDFLYVGVRLRNPHEDAMPIWWWSNIAVPQHPATEVFAPAEHAYRYGYDQTLHHVATSELGNPGAQHNSADFFYDVPAGDRKWIATLTDGFGLVQTSTRRLFGRKLFLWGNGSGGQHWQHWLSPEDGQEYLEIQAGLCTTQLEHRPLPAGEQWTWLEAYGPLEVDAGFQQKIDGRDTRSKVLGTVLDTVLPESTVDEAHEAWLAVLDAEPKDIIHSGSGWGALERPELPGTPYPASLIGAAQQNWADLEQGAGPSPAVTEAPGGTLRTATWRELLATAPATWWTRYHLGVSHYLNGDREAAGACWRESVALHRNAWALRNLSLLAEDADAAADLLFEARELISLPQLDLEAAQAALDANRAEHALAIAGPRTDRFALIRAQALLNLNRPAEALKIYLDGFDIAGVREGETSLSDTWFAIQSALGGADPLPARYDFRMITE
ncbi:DUF5107 domain-containing protein [Pseudonocardiaceae bacterium YIM PH 21723]|nr:DUF5107 domain-containing protein [Pseudonocardiaceae bacterium YIM PH 21723]